MRPLDLNDIASVRANNADQNLYSTRSVILAVAIIWLLLAIFFVFANRHFVHAELFEMSDFAANSLLVQKAKHLRLLVGHYSRVGFNHPGPVLLYVLAAGEWLLFDCLHVVKSPLAGQIFAVAFYSASWLSAIGLLLFRILRSASVTCVGWLTFTAITAYINHNIFLGLWPPHLFYLPFTTFTLALMRLASGRSDSLSALALSCGFLVHGHVSFLPICGIMISGTLVLNRLQSQKASGYRAVLSSEFLTVNRRKIAIAASIFALFLLPLLIETILHFPGPLAQYIAYSRGNKHNNIGNALAFLAHYWRFGLTPLLIGILALYFFANSNALEEIEESSIKSSVSVLFLSTAAVLFYAVVGVDNLSEYYLALFYYAIPSITLALMFSALAQRTQSRKKPIAVVILALIALPFIYRQEMKPVDNEPLYRNTKIPAYFQKVAALAKHTVALDLDQHSDWGRIWPTLVGIEVYAVRQGRGDLFCINKNWHIVFTKQARCTEMQLMQDDRFFVSTTEIGALPSDLDLDGIRFYRASPPRLTLDRNYNIDGNQRLFNSGLLRDGWSSVEGYFVWSDDKTTSITFSVDTAARPRTLVLDVGAYLPHNDSTQAATVFIDGTKIGVIDFSQKDNRGLRRFSLPPLSPQSPIVVQFHIHSPTSPQESNMGRDRRELGIALYGFKLED